MAPGLGRAAALVLVACIVVGLAWLPPRGPSARRAHGEQDAPERTDVQRLRREAAAVARELTAAHETLRFLERRDSLVGLVAASDSAPRGVAAPDVPASWRAWLAAQTDRLPDAGRPSSAPVLTAMFVDTVDPGPATGQRHWRRWRWWNSTVIAFDSAAAPFSCLAIHDLRSRIGTAEHRSLSPPSRWRARTALGICRFFASYGEPGAGVRAWLRDGGWEFGATEGTDQRGTFDPGYVYARREIFWFLLEEGLYGLNRCVHGTLEGCRSWVFAPGGSSAIRLGSLSAFAAGWWTTFGGWLSDLEREMGGERLRRFWTSPLRVDSAFASAFGVDAGQWTYDWLASRHGPLPRRGPRPTDYATTVLLAGLLVAFAAAKTHGRNVR